MKLTIEYLETQFKQRAIILSYRHLYRTALKTIRYARPSRFVLRGIMRDAFRSSDPSEFEAHRIINTLKFLERASESTGIEHKIVKNLLHVRYWQLPHVRSDTKL